MRALCDITGKELKKQEFYGKYYHHDIDSYFSNADESGRLTVVVYFNWNNMIYKRAVCQCGHGQQVDGGCLL